MQNGWYTSFFVSISFHYIVQPSSYTKGNAREKVHILPNQLFHCYSIYSIHIYCISSLNSIQSVSQSVCTCNTNQVKWEREQNNRENKYRDGFPIHTLSLSLSPPLSLCVDYLLMYIYSFACHCIVDWFTQPNCDLTYLLPTINHHPYTGSFKHTHTIKLNMVFCICSRFINSI